MDEVPRDAEEVAPSTARRDFQRLIEAAHAMEAPLLEATRDGTFQALGNERAKRVKSDPWFYKSRLALFLRFHDCPHEWAPKPKGASLAPTPSPIRSGNRGRTAGA